MDNLKIENGLYDPLFNYSHIINKEPSYNLIDLLKKKFNMYRFILNVLLPFSLLLLFLFYLRILYKINNEEKLKEINKNKDDKDDKENKEDNKEDNKDEN